MRRIVIAIGVLMIVVVGGLLIFGATFDVNKYHATIQSQLEKRLGRTTTLGEMHLNVFPPRFRVQNPTIADDVRFSPDSPFVKAQELDISVRLLPLLHKQVEINTLILRRPSVNLVKNAAGEWNFASLGHPAGAGQTASEQKNVPGTAGQSSGQTPAPPPPATEPSSQASTQEQFSLGELTIEDGQVSILDQQKSKTPTLYDHIDVTLKDFSPDHPFTVDAAAHMAGSGSEEVKLQGKGGPIVSGQPMATPFQGTLSLKQVGIADLSKFLNSPVLNGTDGTISGDTRITNEGSKLTAQGESSVQNAKVHGMDLGFPVVAQYDITDDLASDLLTIRNLVVKLGSTPLQISGTVNTKATPAVLDVQAKANNVSIAEAAKIAAAAGVALSQGTVATGNLNADIHAKGPADKPALNGVITASNVQLSGKDIAQPIQIPSLNLNLTPSQVQSNPFSVVSGGTTLNTQFTLRNYASSSPSVDATVRAPNAQLPAILSLAKAYGVASLDKVNGQGTVKLDMRAGGAVKSLNSAEVMRTLNGTADINFNNVKYSGANVNSELASIAKFLNPGAVSGSANGVTNISTMTGHIQVKNGIAETHDLQAKLDIGNVGAAGTANLVDSSLNLRVTAVLSQSVSQKAGGNNVGGFMQTALANNQGELVVPALVTGTFSNPKFSPDVQQIAQMKVKGLIPNLSNPSSVTGALQNILGGKNTSQSTTGQPQGQQTQEANPVQQLMGIFGKKKKSDQRPPK